MAGASTRPGSGWHAAGTCAGPRSGPPGCSAAGPGPVTSRRSPSQAAAWRSCARAWTTSACTAALAGEPSCSCSSGASGATAPRSPTWTAGRSGTPAEQVTCLHGRARAAGSVVTVRIGIVTFPGSLDEVDATRAVARAGGTPVPLWHGDRDLRGVDAVILPGGFSYGDYLRCGAIARSADGSPNGSADDIAGIASADGNVVGLMPPPEHAIDMLTGPGTGGLNFFTSILTSAARA